MKGFETGTIVYEKGLGPKRLYILTKIGDPVEVRAHDFFPDQIGAMGEVKLETFLKAWSLYKGDVQKSWTVALRLDIV